MSCPITGLTFETKNIFWCTWASNFEGSRHTNNTCGKTTVKLISVHYICNCGPREFASSAAAHFKSSLSGLFSFTVATTTWKGILYVFRLNQKSQLCLFGHNLAALILTCFTEMMNLLQKRSMNNRHSKVVCNSSHILPCEVAGDGPRKNRHTHFLWVVFLDMEFAH